MIVARVKMPQFQFRRFPYLQIQSPSNFNAETWNYYRSASLRKKNTKFKIIPKCSNSVTHSFAAQSSRIEQFVCKLFYNRNVLNGRPENPDDLQKSFLLVYKCF